MGVLSWIIGAGVVGGLIHKSNKKAREEAAEQERRRNTPCRFIDDFSESEFELMAINAAKHIKRLCVSVEGPTIYGTVQSQSGISEWYFKVDFNDYGHITGRYWLSSDNSDSSIPEHYADKLSSLIQNYDPDDYDSDDNDDESLSNSKVRGFVGNFCPYCGEKLTVHDSAFCSFCGKKLV